MITTLEDWVKVNKAEPTSIEVMSFMDNLGEDWRTVYWKTIDRQRFQWLSPIRSMIRSRFDSERRALVESAQDAATPDMVDGHVIAMLLDQEPMWEQTILRLYLTVGEAFGRSIQDQFKSEKQEGDLFEQEVLRWLGLESGKKVTQINDTTRQQLRNEIASGVAEGEGIPKLAKRVDSLYIDKIMPNRSTVIARTEVISASNLGSRAGAKETGLVLIHTWLTTQDGRTRESHSGVDGQKQDLDDPFSVMGEQLMFPGDTSLGASAGNIIQCRCTETYSKQ